MNTAKKLTLGLLRGSGAAAEFSPLDITGLALWLDASDSTTLFQDNAGTTPATADGDVVGRWADKSGTAHHATQATLGNKPVLKLAAKNGLNTVRFTAVDDYLLVPYGSAQAQPWTYFLVMVRTAGDYVMDGSGGDRQIFFNPVLGINAGTLLPSVGVTSTNWNVFTLVFNGASSGIRANGAPSSSGNAGTAGITNLVIGARGSFNQGMSGDIAEFIAVKALPSAGTIAATESYLNSRWGVY